MRKNNTFPSESDIHAYVDGRLDEISQRRMRAWMRVHPERAKIIADWQRDARELQTAYADLPMETSAAISPRAPHPRRWWRTAIVAASLFLAVGVSGIAGWQLHDRQQDTSAPMADAVQAYRLFALDRSAPLDVVRTSAGDIQAWMSRRFPGVAHLPDLSASGFRVVGARLLADTAGPAAIVVYRNQAGESVSFYVRSPDPGTRPIPRGERHDGQLAVNYWSSDGYNYALVAGNAAIMGDSQRVTG
ncbi:MAG: anti-sigma factor [Candidimonas sp.]|nr:MAG: anti-sigma factor [Candidimonas sp.]